MERQKTEFRIQNPEYGPPASYLLPSVIFPLPIPFRFCIMRSDRPIEHIRPVDMQNMKKPVSDADGREYLELAFLVCVPNLAKPQSSQRLYLKTFAVLAAL